MARLLITTLALLALACPATAQTPSGSMMLYTSEPPQDAEATIAAFLKIAPNVQAAFIRDGTTQLMTRLQTEFAAGAPRPDVLLIADAITMEQLKQQHRLLAYPQANLASLPAACCDPDHTYFGTKFITTGIVYHNGAKPPESWRDLLDANAHNQVVLPSPLYSGAAAIFMGTLAALPDVGLPYFHSLAQNGAVAVAGNGQVLTEVAGGQKQYGVMVDFMALNAKAAGSPVNFVFPREGVSVVTEPVAILATAHNLPAAKAFVDFLLSEAGQRFAASRGYLPMRADVPAPPGFPPRPQIKILPPPMASIMQNEQADRRHFADDFGG